MKSYHELKLIGTPSEQEKVIERIEENLCNGWERAKDQEAKYRNEHKMEYRIFLCSKTALRPTAALLLRPDENEYLYIDDIKPKEVELGVKGYNAILEEFVTKFVEPAVQGLNIRITTTVAETTIDNSITGRTIDNSMSPELAEKLKRFSNCANKSRGGSHPFDQQRFFEFIIQGHLEKSLLDESTLEKLLIDEGWSKKYADELASRYNFGRKLLQFYS